MDDGQEMPKEQSLLV